MNVKQTRQTLQLQQFWNDITKRTSKLYIQPINQSTDRYSLVNTDNDDEWKQVLKEWNLSQYIDNFIKNNGNNNNNMEQWRKLTKSDLLNIGLLEVDAQIFLNMIDHPQNVANDKNNDLNLIKNRIEIKNENEQNLLDTMDDSSKEVMKSMTDLMTMTSNGQKQDDNENENENENGSKQDVELNDNNMNSNVENVDDKENKETEEPKNAEEQQEQDMLGLGNTKTAATATATSTIDTFGDLEQFADGLDLDNVEVDSDTEQNLNDRRTNDNA